MRFTLNIECDNAEFDGPHCTASVARILREAAAAVGKERKPLRGATKLRDINGNTVGAYEFQDK